MSEKKRNIFEIVKDVLMATDTKFGTVSTKIDQKANLCPENQNRIKGMLLRNNLLEKSFKSKKGYGDKYTTTQKGKDYVVASDNLNSFLKN